MIHIHTKVIVPNVQTAHPLTAGTKYWKGRTLVNVATRIATWRPGLKERGFGQVRVWGG
jgi:hypothetical protein